MLISEASPALPTTGSSGCSSSLSPACPRLCFHLSTWHIQQQHGSCYMIHSNCGYKYLNEGTAEYDHTHGIHVRAVKLPSSTDPQCHPLSLYTPSLQPLAGPTWS